MIVVILIVHANLFAQSDLIKANGPRYRIRLITLNDNMLKGLLLEVRDSSLLIYPGKRKEWKNKIPYKPVEFEYTRIKRVAIRKRNGTWTGMPLKAGFPTAVLPEHFSNPHLMN